MPTRSIAGAALALSLLCFGTAASAAPSILGTWLTESKALVRIEPCGAATCGRMLKTPSQGLPGGPGAGKQNETMAGRYILTGLVDAGSVWKGEIHNPANGKTYNAKISRNGDGTLNVEVCLAFLCKGLTWRPAN